MHEEAIGSMPKGLKKDRIVAGERFEVLTKGSAACRWNGNEDRLRADGWVERVDQVNEEKTDATTTRIE